MKIVSKLACVFAIAGGMSLWAAAAIAGPKLDIASNSWMQVSVLGQAQGSVLENAADDDDVFLRRLRLVVAGQIMDGVKVFVETDNDNAGKNGEAAVSTDIQDAWIDVRLGHFEMFGESEHWLQAGLILLPFSFENRSTAGALLGLDYNTEAMKFVNTFVWRDQGVELHGNFGKKVAYRVGAFDGYDAPAAASATFKKNDDASARVTGHIAVNLLGDVETGWFFTQERQGKAGCYISVGAGVDSQNKATIATATNSAGRYDVRDAEAWVVDLQSGFEVGKAAITINGAYYDWENASFKGNTAFVETGVMVGKVMPTAKYSLTDKDGAVNVEDYTAGLHYFLKGHNARVGVEYRWGDSLDLTLVGVQFLL